MGYSDEDVLGQLSYPQNTPANYTDEDVMGAVGVPPSGPVTAPGTDQGTQPVAGPPPSEILKQTLANGPLGTASAKASVSGSQFNEDTYNKILKTQGRVAADMAREKATFDANDAAAADKEAAATEAGKSAVTGEAQASADLIAEKGRQNAHLARMQNDFATEEAGIVAREQGEAAKAKAEYTQALNEFRAAKVNPSQLWDSLGRSGQFGMGAVAFAHGFLGASGIKEDGLELFMKGVDRNIDAQIQNIKIKGESVGMFKQLWDMQRQQSASDAEARVRVRGFAIESAKHAVDSELSKYDSALAVAQGRTASAKLDVEAAKNYAELMKIRDQHAEEYTKQSIDIWKESARLSMDKYKAELQFGNKGLKPGEGNIYTLVNPETNKDFAVFKPEFQGDKFIKERSDVTADVAKMVPIMNGLKKLGEMARQIDAEPRYGTEKLLGQTRMADELHRRYQAIAAEIAAEQARTEAGRSSFQEIQQFMKTVPMEQFYTVGGVNQVLADTIQHVNDSTYGFVQQYTKPLDEGAPRPYQGAYDEANAILHPEQLSPEKTARLSAEKSLEGGSATESLPSDVGDDVKKDHARFLAANPTKGTLSPGEQLSQKVGETAPMEKIKSWEADFTHLREQAEKGGSEGEASLRSLVKYANGFALDSEDPKALYAVIMLHELGLRTPDVGDIKSGAELGDEAKKLKEAP